MDDPGLSPLYATAGGLPPVLLQVGSTELPLDDVRKVHERIAPAGGESVLEVYSGVPRCWQMVSPLLPEARHSIRAAAAFIAAHAKAERPLATAG